MQVSKPRIFALFLLGVLASGCTKYIPKSKTPEGGFQISRVNLLDTIPDLVPGGMVLNIAFHQLTFDGSRMIGRVGNRADRVVRYSLDGGETWIEVTALGKTQTELDWEVPRVDVSTALVQVVAKSSSGIEVLLQSPIFEIRSSGPVLSQTRRPYSSFSNTTVVTFGGSCESPFVVTTFKQVAGGTEKLGDAPCTNNQWEFEVTSTVDGQTSYRFQADDSFGHRSFVNALWTLDRIPPVATAGSFKLANGAASVTSNYVPISLEANDSHTNITHFCLTYVTSPDQTATVLDGCWVAVNDPDQPALAPAKSLTLRALPNPPDFLYRIGYVLGTYHASVWVRDAAGNVSNELKTSVYYDPGAPPVVINVMGSKSDPPAMPFTMSDLSVPQGTAVTIRWKIAAAINGLTTTPVSLYYTSDDLTFTPIAEGIADGAHGGCTLAGGLSTGCYVWTSTVPSTSYFRVRVAITDKNGMIASSSTNPLNGAGLSLIAGNTDAGIGASANAAIFVAPRFGYVVPDSGSFVVDNRGYIFFRDSTKGILWMKPSDGIVRVLMPLSAAALAHTYQGPLPAADGTVKAPARIALDYSGGLLIWDYDRIRRVDIEAMTVATLIGGGTSTADGVAANLVQFTARGGLGPHYGLSQLVPLPNGNILFESDGYVAPNTRLRVFKHHNGQVSSIYYSGAGHGHSSAGPAFDSQTEDLTTCATIVLGENRPCRTAGYAVEYNTVSSVLQTLQVALAHSVVGNSHFPIANLVPSGAEVGTSLLPHPPTEGSSDRSHYRVIGRNGKIYSVNRAEGRISVFKKETVSPPVPPSWTKLVGSTLQGTCVDGTPALSCAITPSDAFVDAQGNLFFLDRGRIRTVDGSGNVITIYGQSHFFGDGGYALSSRFNVVPHLDVANDGEVTIIDSSESRLRAFVPGGAIHTIAGNGTTQAFPNNTDPAVDQPYTIASAGIEQWVFSINSATKDVYTTNFRDIAMLNRSTGRWQTIAGGGLTYIPSILGFDGTQVLVHTNKFNSAVNYHSDAFIRQFSLAGAATPFTGIGGVLPLPPEPPLPPRPTEFCDDGTPVASCAVPKAHSSLVGRAQFDGPGQRWLMLQNGTRYIKVFPKAAGATVSTLKVVARPASSFAYVNDSGGERVYYCGSNGRLYRSDVGSGAADTALSWRIPSMTCKGTAMVYRPSNNSLIFPVLQTGLYGVAEFVLP